MTMFFEIDDDKAVAGRWHLGDVLDAQGAVLDGRIFRTGVVAEHLRTPIMVEQQYPGTVMDFTVAAFGVPIIRSRVASAIADLVGGDVQLLPAKVLGDGGDWTILNCTRVEKCLDEKNTLHVTRWTTADHRADLAGQYRAVDGLRVLETVLHGVHMVRPWGWTVALVVSADFRDLLESAGVSGASYVPV